MRRSAGLLTLGLLLFVPRGSSADPVVVFSNFGLGDTYSSGAGPILGPGVPIGEDDVTPGQWFAASFFVSQTVQFTSIELALSTVPLGGDAEPAPVPVTLRLVESDGGVPGTADLDTLTVTAETSLFQLGAIESATSTLRPLLLPGVEYWFIASTLAEGQAAGWMQSLTDTRFLPAAIRRVDTDWGRSSPNGAFRVFGEIVDDGGTSPVPEPATMTLLGTGLAAIALRSRRRRNQG